MLFVDFCWLWCVGCVVVFGVLVDELLFDVVGDFVVDCVDVVVLFVWFCIGNGVDV